MPTIRKKIWPGYFDAVASGKKKFELRLNDFDVAEGDTLVLEEWDPKTGEYTGRSIERKVGFVYKFKIDELFWPEAAVREKGLQVLSLDEPRVLVGMGIFVFRDGKVLLGRRRNAHGEGEFAPPGGHLEYMESYSDCVRRELEEE